MRFRIALILMLSHPLAAQEPRKDAPPPPQTKDVQSGSGVVAVNPAQPYRPIPVNANTPRESIFGFYLRALNPRQINWGTEIDRRLAALRAQSVGNPYFRLASFQLAAIVILLMLCWVGWDKMRQIKWLAAECLTDALNARSLAEARAVEAIERHNRHLESCNRVIEGQVSGVGRSNDASNAAVTIRELQTELAASRAACLRLQHELDQSKAAHAQVDSRLASLEAEMRRRALANPDAELVARLEKAESELANRKAKRQGA